MSDQALSVDELLSASGLAELSESSTHSEVEIALRELRSRLNGADPLRVTVVRAACIERLGEIGVRSPAKLVDAALGGFGAEERENRGEHLLLSDPTPYPDEVDGAGLLRQLLRLT